LQLPIQLANQIAAGEVVERPASVVKELLENSLDAGATRIDIDISNGGLQSIRIQDNGHGIRADDLALALSRHATSKIDSIEALSQVTSLGFRGEALPSIASVSRFQIISRHRDDGQGSRIDVSAEGELSDVLPAAHPIGSTVLVDELFYNAPARRRFMRAARTEFNHILEVVQRIALSAPSVAVTLRHNGRQALRLVEANDVESRQRRVSQIYGKDFFQQAKAVIEHTNGIELRGYVAPASVNRATADHQYVYINGRIVRDRVLNHGIRLAFVDDLPVGRFACFVLYLDIDPSLVDVNVHPTKHEVRFRQSREVHDFLFSAVRRALVADVHELEQTDTPQTDNPSLMSVQEPASVYSLSKPVSTSSQNHGRRGFSVTQIKNPFGVAYRRLAQRYVACFEADAAWLLDGQSMMQSSYQQRLSNAVKKADIDSRPLLVPQRMVLPAEQLDELESNFPRLQKFGFLLTRSSTETALLRRAPVLLQLADDHKVFDALLLHWQKDDALVCEQLALAAALSTAIPESGRALQDWLSQQLAMLADNLANIESAPWVVKLNAHLLSTMFGSK